MKTLKSPFEINWPLKQPKGQKYFYGFFIVHLPCLLTDKLSCLQKNKSGHAILNTGHKIHLIVRFFTINLSVPISTATIDALAVCQVSLVIGFKFGLKTIDLTGVIRSRSYPNIGDY